MRDLDNLIRDHLERTARPPQLDPGLFDGIDRRRAQRATRRRIGSGALGLVILALFAAVAFALSRSAGGPIAPATHSPPSPMPTVQPVSPNGAIVVVFADANGHHSLWSVSAGTQTRLTSGPNDLQPAVNPTGDKVAFSRTEGSNGTGGSGIYTVPIEGGRISRLLDASWFATDPSWSPDGTEIAFAGGGHLAGQSLNRPSGIYVMSVGGQTVPKLIYAGKTDFAVEGHPSWSPDGSKLVFQGANAALSTPPSFDLYVINSDGSGPATDITNSPESETGPAWSPDGTRIAFSLQPAPVSGVLAPPATKGSITTIAMDGSRRVLLTDGKTLDVDPAWSPDGKLIVFARTVGHRSGPSYILEVSATGRPQIISTGTNGGDPFWQKVH